MKRFLILILLLVCPVAAFATVPIPLAGNNSNYNVFDGGTFSFSFANTDASSDFLVLQCSAVRTITFNTPTYAGVNATGTISNVIAAAGEQTIMWYWSLPTQGTNNFSVSRTGSSTLGCAFESLSHVSMSSPIGTPVTSTASLQSTGVVCSSTSGNYTISGASDDNSTTLATPNHTQLQLYPGATSSTRYPAGIQGLASTGSNITFTWGAGTANPVSFCVELNGDTSTSITMDNANIWLSPWFNVLSGSSYDLMVRTGSQFRLRFSGVTMVQIAVDVTQQTGCAGGPVGSTDYPSWAYNAFPAIIATSRDNGVWVTRQETNSDTTVTLLGQLKYTETYDFSFIQYALGRGVSDHWNGPCSSTKITGITLSGPSTPTYFTPTTLSKKALMAGDSIMAGYTSALQDIRWAWDYDVAIALGAEGGFGAIEGTGLDKANGANVPNGKTMWYQAMNGVSLIGGGGTFTVCPDYVLFAFGVVDNLGQTTGGSETPAATFQTDYAAMLADAKTKTAGCGTKIIAIVPTTGVYRANVLAAAASTGGIYTADPSTDAYFGVYGGAGFPTIGSGDGVHPDTAYHAIIGAKMSQAIQLAIGGSGSHGMLGVD